MRRIMERLYQAKNRTPFVKDAFHRYLIEGERGAVNPERKGTKARGAFQLDNSAGEELDHSTALDGYEPRRSACAAEGIFRQDI